MQMEDLWGTRFSTLHFENKGGGGPTNPGVADSGCRGEPEKGGGDGYGGLCKLQIKEAGLSLNSYFGNTHGLHQKMPYMGEFCWRMAQMPEGLYVK